MDIMRTKKIIWEAHQEQKLVKLVKEKDFIWDAKHKHFLNLRKRKETLTEIAKKLGPNFTADEVKDRWKNIRNTYRQNLRRIKNSKTSSDCEYIYEPSWHLWNCLQFLKGHERASSPCLPLSSSGIEKVTIKTDAHHHISDQSECEKLLYEAKNLLNYLHEDPRLDSMIDLNLAKTGKKVAKLLSKMSTNDAEDATKKIMHILSEYPSIKSEYPSSIKP